MSMEISKLNKSWYRHWWGVPIVVITLPLFAFWYVWIELERSKLFRLSATTAILALCAGVISVAYALPWTTKPSLTNSKPTATNLAVSLPINPTASNNIQTTTNKPTTAPQNVTRPTAKPSSTTTPQPTSVATAITPTPVTQTPVSTPPLTLEQQYPNTYPAKWANIPINSIIDTWGMDNRESVSYTAWKVNETFGNMPQWGFGMPSCDSSSNYDGGDAKCWPADAKTAGIPIGTTPQVHSVAIFTNQDIQSPGFSAWVEAINGNQVTVSSYNWGNGGNYSVSVEPSSYFSTYIYFSGN